jgi:isopenicillin N synthase-like dioxygenase
VIPVIDVGALRGPDGAAEQEVCDQISEACRTIGFFYVANHGVPEALIEATYQQAANFHALPRAEKQRYHIAKSRNHRGYVPPGEEDYGSEPGVGLKESFDLAADLPTDDPDFAAGYRFLGPNVWPDLPDFHNTVDAYYNAVVGLGHVLLGGLTRALGLPEGTLAPLFTKPTSNLRLLHYPAPAAGRDGDALRLGIGSHTDSECFTILHQTKPGLQVMTVDDRWIDVTPKKGTFVVNAGDTLETLTNGHFKSGPHRVIQIDEERYSLPLFFGANFDALIEPLPTFVTQDNPRRYDGFRSGEHILSEYAKGFRYLRDLHRHGIISLRTAPNEKSRYVRSGSLA